MPEVAIEGAAIKPIDLEPIVEHLQLSPGVVDVVLLQNSQDPLGNVDDGEVVAQGKKRLWATAIFGWRRACATHTDRIGSRRIGGQDLFDADLVPPEGAKVVLVGKAFVRAEVKIGQAHVPRIISEGDPAEIGAVSLRRLS